MDIYLNENISVSSLGNIIEKLEALADRGTCAGQDGSFRGIETNEGSACNVWETYR